MTVEHSFFLNVTPNAAQRTKATCRGKFANVYLDPKYRDWRDRAKTKLEALAQFENFSAYSERPIRITTEVAVRRPKTSKLFAPRGDLDNYEKGLWDAMTEAGKWWRDDGQIVECRTLKRWTEGDEPEGYYVTVEFL